MGSRDDKAGGPSDKQVSSDPLYGATPPEGSSSTEKGSSLTPPPPPLETASTSSSAAADTSPMPAAVTTNPLFGASPDSRGVAPPIPHRSSRSPLPLHHPSALPAYLRRLGYILSLVLGSSAVIAGIWSVFLLPLLHASFSARRALVEQQKDRWAGLLGRVRAIRQGRLYQHPSSGEGERVEEYDGQVTVIKRQADQVEAEDSEGARLMDHAEDSDSASASNEIESDRLLPLNPISSLSSSLADLATALSSTSTTRTSLLSTLEAYTSHLHRQVYLRSQPLSAGGRYGLGTLSANLAKAGGGTATSGVGGRWPYDKEESTDGGLEAAGVKSEEWDAVRKEVRAIKGMLLSRRNFMQVTADSDTR